MSKNIKLIPKHLHTFAPLMTQELLAKRTGKDLGMDVLSTIPTTTASRSLAITRLNSANQQKALIARERHNKAQVNFGNLHRKNATLKADAAEKLRKGLISQSDYDTYIKKLDASETNGLVRNMHNTTSTAAKILSPLVVAPAAMAAAGSGVAASEIAQAAKAAAPHVGNFIKDAAIKSAESYAVDGAFLKADQDFNLKQHVGDTMYNVAKNGTKAVAMFGWNPVAAVIFGVNQGVESGINAGGKVFGYDPNGRNATIAKDVIQGVGGAFIDKTNAANKAVKTIKDVVKSSISESAKNGIQDLNSLDVSLFTSNN